VLKLWPSQDYRATAWVSLAEGAPLPEIAARLRRETADLVSTFELISGNSLALVERMRGGALGVAAGSGGALLI
ncbi:hypothetical protein, partial [Enterobacter cloacae]